MSSLQQKTTVQGAPTQESYVASFERNLASLEQAAEVELVMKKLKFLGLNYDPFGPEVTDECKAVMEGLGLTPHLSNPYQATNLLLRLLDKTEERLNELKH